MLSAVKQSRARRVGDPHRGGHPCKLVEMPLSHLDLPSREAFEAALLGFGGTVVAVLHDRYAIARIATRLDASVRTPDHPRGIIG